MTTPVFRESKTIQVATSFLQLTGETSEFRLASYIYLFERTLLVQCGFLALNEVLRCCCGTLMPSHTVRLMDRQGERHFAWLEHIDKSKKNTHTALSNETGELCIKDKEVIEAIHQEHSKRNDLKLDNFMRGLPECSVQLKAITFSYQEILTLEGWSERDIAIIQGEIEHITAVDKLLAA